MTVDKRISYDVQGGVKNYLGKQKEVTAPVKWKSSPDSPETELAYITKAEKDLLVKKDLHGSLKGGVNRGPSGIMSLDGFGSTDPNQNVSGSQISAAETGSAGSGMSAQDRDDFRSAAIAAGAGQRVNPGFFDDRNTVSKAELARAKKFAPKAFAKTRGGFGNFIQGGGILGAVLSGVGRAFGLGKRYNTPYDRPEFAPGFATNAPQMQYDIGNELLEELANEELEKQELNNVGTGFVTATGPNFNSLLNQNKNRTTYNRSDGTSFGLDGYMTGKMFEEQFGTRPKISFDYDPNRVFEGILGPARDFLDNTSEDYRINSNTISPYQAKVTQDDINKSKTRTFKSMDYDTYKMINPDTQVTPYEFDQLQKGNITEPGTYTV